MAQSLNLDPVTRSLCAALIAQGATITIADRVLTAEDVEVAK